MKGQRDLAEVGGDLGLDDVGNEGHQRVLGVDAEGGLHVGQLLLHFIWFT